MKSILHDKNEGTCYLCKLLYDDHARKLTTEHHVEHGTANRRIAEKYGLKVYLCFHHHGELGAEDVHRPDLNNYDQQLHMIAQKAFEKRWGSRAEWMNLIGKNYL